MNATATNAAATAAELSEMGKQILRAVRLLNAAESGTATGEATAALLGATAAQVRGARLALVKRGLVALVEGAAYLTATGEAVAEEIEPTAPQAAPAAEAPQAEAEAPAAEAAELGKRATARRDVLNLTGVTGEALYRAMGRIEAQEGEGKLYPVGVAPEAAALYYSLDAAAWVWHGLKVTRAQAGGLIEQGGKHFAG